MEQNIFFTLKGLESMLREINSGALVHSRDNLRMRIMGYLGQYNRNGYFKNIEKTEVLIQDAKQFLRESRVQAVA